MWQILDTKTEAMRKKNMTAGVAHPVKERLFVEANTAWDIGDLRLAFALFSETARLGDAASQVDLGYFGDNGLSVKKDKKKALTWYRKAYLQGDYSAANNIATVYRDWGDTNKMLWWFRRAAAMGDTVVMLDLGKRYESGLAVPVNIKKAKLYYGRVLPNEHATEGEKAEAKVQLTGLRRSARTGKGGKKSAPREN
jgi:TPR repeat protein